MQSEDLESILPFIPLLHRSATLFWPPRVIEALKALSRGPAHSHVNSGELFAIAISDIRSSLSSPPLPTPASNGFGFFFDELMHEDVAASWFTDVVPRLASLLLELPSMLEDHYANAIVGGIKTGLRLLEPQQPGIVLLSQDLIGALLACGFFCLFPTNRREFKHLPPINFNGLFSCIFENYEEKIEHKIKCIIHYFERICKSMPGGKVSFQRKVIRSHHSRFDLSLAKDDFWSNSSISLCRFQVCSSGCIEDQSNEVLEVDFANKYFGGGALHRGCVQEEIRFMINPELIVGMLFLPEMEDNEAIEIVGTERFSDYIGYAGSFRFRGDYVDQKKVDSHRRRKTRIVAIDALSSPGRRQYRTGFLLREINKAFCGFLDQDKLSRCNEKFQRSNRNLLSLGDPSTSSQGREEDFGGQRNYPMNKGAGKDMHHLVDKRSEIGLATGNWGCGVFGGDPEVKSVLQWLAASQARRPFILYYTFHLDALRRLDQVVQWIISHQWNVGELWDMLVEYASQKLQGDTQEGFFDWLLPPLHDNNNTSLHGAQVDAIALRDNSSDDTTSERGEDHDNSDMALHGDQDDSMSPPDDIGDDDVLEHGQDHDIDNMALHGDQDDSMSSLDDIDDDDVSEHGQDHDINDMALQSDQDEPMSLGNNDDDADISERGEDHDTNDTTLHGDQDDSMSRLGDNDDSGVSEYNDDDI